MKHLINIYVARCVCERNKGGNIPYLGFLQPLPISHHAWRHVSMDFLERLPKSKGKDVIFVVVDRMKQFTHFMSLSHPYKALTVA